MTARHSHGLQAGTTLSFMLFAAFVYWTGEPLAACVFVAAALSAALVAM